MRSKRFLSRFAMDSLDVSRIQRVVLLIDLHPLLRLQNPNSYLFPVLSAARRILSFTPLSSSLFAYKLFFSSLSPILSTSKVHHLLGKSPTFLSFDHPPNTLTSLYQTLNSLAPVSGLGHSTGLSSPSASLLARSLLQLEHDYGWEIHSQNPKGTPELLIVRSNLVVLFSPVPQSLNFLSEYIDLEAGVDENSSISLDEFLNRFFKIFGLVKERLVSKDIHISWIDVDLEPRCTEENLGSCFLEKAVRELGWGFSSTDAIVLGSALVPFGLIFPYIGCAMESIPASGAYKGRMELVLGILDVSGRPLDCKICDLEVLDLKLLGERSDIRDLFSNNSGKGFKKIRMAQVWKKGEGEKLMFNPSALVLVHRISGDCKKERKSISRREFFADRILEMLCTETGELAEGKPIWQLLLAFLYSRNYWASVSISDSDGTSLKGILLPLTINYALLGIVEKNSLGLCQSAISTSNGSSEILDISTPSASKDKDDRRRRKMQAYLFQNATLTSFREAVFSHGEDNDSGADLEELYFGGECSISKKMRFLKCWMRQVKKSSNCSNIVLNELKEYPDVKEEAEKRVVALQEEPGSHIFASSADDSYLSGSANEEASPFSCMEDTETFLGSIPQKIEEGLCSGDADLGFLAERLVALSIHALYMKFGRNAIKESSSKEAEDASDLKIVTEISHRLFRKPRDLILKYKGVNPVSHSLDQSTTIYSTENIIREHELQVLFRMEMLRSKIGASIEEKQKMIKEICSLLQFIDINLQGDTFHSEDIVKFAERTVKTRYAHCLGDVIHKIYKQMEFDLFDEDEVEASDTLPNSNSDETRRNDDSNDRIPKIATGLVVGAPSYKHQQEKRVESQQKIMENVQERQLMKALERRNRDRKLSSFTSWMPDLQRVWALKQPRAKRPTLDHLRKPSKRRKQRVAANDMVCETPMTGKNCSNVQEDDTGCGINSCRSLSKALFHHEGDSGSSIIS